MSDEIKPTTVEPTAEEKTASLVSAAVTAGLKTALPEVVKQTYEQINASGSVRREVVQPVRQEQTIADVREEDILEAISAGDSAKAATLMRQQRRADEQKRNNEIARITSAGGAAFGSVSRMSADKLPYYTGKYKKLIDDKIAQFQENNPGVMITPEHYKAAHDIIVGENITDIQAADREEAIRKSREPDPALIPDGGRGGIETHEQEPENLEQILGGDWKKEFRVKQRAVGGRSDDEELKKLGYRGGFVEFAATRKQMDALDEDTMGSFGLDKDWVDDQGRTGQRASKDKGAWI